MRGINQVFLMGHLGHEPELRTTKSGKQVCDLRLATHRSTRTDRGWESQTDWHRVRLWDRHAEVAAQYLQKGHPVAVQGALRADAWTDSEGNPRKRTVVYCQKLHLVRAPRSIDPQAPRPGSALPDTLEHDVGSMPPGLATPGLSPSREAPF